MIEFIIGFYLGVALLSGLITWVFFGDLKDILFNSFLWPLALFVLTLKK